MLNKLKIILTICIFRHTTYKKTIFFRIIRRTFPEFLLIVLLSDENKFVFLVRNCKEKFACKHLITLLRAKVQIKINLNSQIISKYMHLSNYSLNLFQSILKLFLS